MSTQHQVLPDSLLLSLPPELRVLIYSYLNLIPPRINNIELTSSSPNQLILPKPSPLALTCTTIYLELASLYFSQSTFALDCCYRDNARTLAIISELRSGSIGQINARFPRKVRLELENGIRIWFSGAVGEDEKSVRCERYLVKKRSGLGRAVLLKRCGCDLRGVEKMAREEGWDLLRFAEEVVRGLGEEAEEEEVEYDSDEDEKEDEEETTNDRLIACESCGLRIAER